jgi:hypothetical protein
MKGPVRFQQKLSQKVVHNLLYQRACSVKSRRDVSKSTSDKDKEDDAEFVLVQLLGCLAWALGEARVAFRPLRTHLGICCLTPEADKIRPYTPTNYR